MEFLLTILVFLSWIITVVNGIPVFKINGKQCLDQSVEYQCTVTGSSPTNILTWRVYTDIGTQFGSPHTYISNTIGANLSIGGVFTVEQLSQSPLISNISFTVQSSINGYTIICEDGITLNIENFTIDISGIVEPPNNISFTSSESSVNITWTQPNSECISSYSITSNATNSIITTTDTSVDIPLAGLSPGVYCVSVATVDTANRTGVYSNEGCNTLQAPPLPGYSYELSSATESLDHVIATVSSTFNLTSTVPVLTAGYIVVDSQVFKGKLTNYNNNQITIEFSVTLELGVNYSIMCFGENVLGNGSIVTFDIYINLSDVSPSVTQHISRSMSFMSTVVASIASDAASNTLLVTSLSKTKHDCGPTLIVIHNTLSISTCVDTSPMSATCPSVTGLSSSVSAGISIAITVPVTAVITAVITAFIILYLCGYKKINKASKTTPPHIITNEVEMKGNTAYGQVQYTTGINSKAATIVYDTVNQLQ